MTNDWLLALIGSLLFAVGGFVIQTVQTRLRVCEAQLSAIQVAIGRLETIVDRLERDRSRT